MAGSVKCSNRNKYSGDSGRSTILARVIREGLSVEVTFEYKPENVRGQVMRTRESTVFQENHAWIRRHRGKVISFR